MDLQENVNVPKPKPVVTIEYEPQFIHVTKNPVIIVGMCPGRVRKSIEKRLAWHGNRSADLLESSVKGVKNLILTNIINTYTTAPMTDEMIRAGVDELEKLFIKYEPKKVVFVGGFAEKHGKEILHGTPCGAINHPSFVLRFGKDTTWWKKKMRNLLVSVRE